MNCLALVIILYAVIGGYILGREAYACDAPPGYEEHGQDGVHRGSIHSRHSGGNIVASPDDASKFL